jgi:hypothetical protein
MNNLMPNLSSSATMVADDAMLPPHAPLVMPKQVLSADVTLYSHATTVMAAMLSVLKPRFRGAN